MTFLWTERNNSIVRVVHTFHLRKNQITRFMRKYNSLQLAVSFFCMTALVRVSTLRIPRKKPNEGFDPIKLWLSGCINEKRVKMHSEEKESDMEVHG